jgi:hypothetical protein
LWCEAHFEVKSVRNGGGSDPFWTVRCRFAWQAQGIRHLAKSEQNVCSISKKGWQAWDICRGSAEMHFAWQAQYKSSSEVLGGQGADFLRILQHQTFRFTQMIYISITHPVHSTICHLFMDFMGY